MRLATKLFLTFCIVLLGQLVSCKSQAKPNPRTLAFQHFVGDGWLAWSVAERTEYVDTYLAAYSSAYREACQNAENIWIAEAPKGKPVKLASPTYEKGDENRVDVPLSHCLNSQPKYSLGHRDANGLVQTPYAEIITETYEKHSDARSAPYFLLITLLSDGHAQTSDELYKDQLNRWPNARFDPHDSSTP